MKNVTKSLTALLLALVMSLTLLPTQVLAAESGIAARSSTGTVYATEYVNPIYADVLQSGTGIRIQAIPSTQAAVAAQAADSVNYLTEAEAVKELRKQMIARNENITLSVKLSSGDDVGAAVQRIWESAQGHVSGCGTAGDYLRWQYGGFSCPEFPYSDDGKYITFTVTYQRAASRSSLWYTTAKQETQLTSYIKSTILPQLALNGKTTYQKVQAIYDWITRNVRYDKKNLDDNSYYLKYTAYAAAINKTAVCQGYANLFYRLANDAGIDCRIVAGQGNGGGHSWNIVRMDDDKYYCLDATWDEGQTKYSYFLKGTTAFNTDHMVNAETTPYWSGYAAKVSAADYKVKAADTKVGTVELTGAKGAADGITVTWKAAANAAKYVVYRKTADSKWVKLATVGSGTLSYKDTSAAHGVQYTYTVKGIAADGTAGKANSTGVSAMRAPAAVKMGKATASSANITVTWGKADGAAKYVVYRKTADSKWVKLATVGSSTLKYADKTVANGVQYTYTVLACAADGKTKGGYDSTGLTVMMVPATVELSKATHSATNITVTWKAAAGAKTYRVYRKAAGESKWTTVAKSVSGTSYTDKTVKVGVKYTYTVKGIASDGKTLSAKYNAAGVSDTLPKGATPAKVTLTGISTDSAGITIRWQKAANATKYYVYRKDTTNTKWKKVAVVSSTGAASYSYKDTTVTRNVAYTYTVRGVSSDGQTMGGYNAAGKTAKVTASASATPAYVTMKDARRVTSGTKGIRLTWTTTNNAKTYNVYRAANPPKDKKGNPANVPTSKWKLVGQKVDALSFLDVTGKSCVTYAYTVRGVAANGKTLSTNYNTVGLRATMP